MVLVAWIRRFLRIHATRTTRSDSSGWWASVGDVASTVSPDLILEPLSLEAEGFPARPLGEWLTTFHLASVVLDPYTNESSWILKTAARILHGFSGAAVRTNLIVTADADDAKAFLGPLTKEFLVFTDPQRDVVRGLGLTSLPAFVFIQSDGTVPAVAQGWNPAEWRAVAAKIASVTAWSTPSVPVAADPAPFSGTAALG